MSAALRRDRGYPGRPRTRPASRHRLAQASHAQTAGRPGAAESPAWREPSPINKQRQEARWEAVPAQRGGVVGDPSLTCRAHRHPLQARRWPLPPSWLWTRGQTRRKALRVSYWPKLPGRTGRFSGRGRRGRGGFGVLRLCPGATVTKRHQPRGFKQETCRVSVLEARHPRSMCPQGRAPSGEPRGGSFLPRPTSVVSPGSLTCAQLSFLFHAAPWPPHPHLPRDPRLWSVSVVWPSPGLNRRVKATSAPTWTLFRRKCLTPRGHRSNNDSLCGSRTLGALSSYLPGARDHRGGVTVPGFP